MAKSPLLPLEEAVAAVLQPLEPLPPEWVSLAEAAGRTLAEPVRATRTLPAGPVSAMDGYAVRAEDAPEPGAELPVSARIEAGGAPGTPLPAGAAARIFTGGTLPPGADAIVLQEDVDVLPDGRIRLGEGARSGAHVRAEGLDFRLGDALLEPGTRLDGRHLALAAAGDAPWLCVRRRPRVAVLATGSELERPGSGAAKHKVIASSGFALQNAIANWGGTPLDLGLAPDTLDGLRPRIRDGLGADFLVTLGGASVGEPDLVKKALAAEGYAEDFWRVAMKPGKPVFFGRLGSLPVLGLPGNPVSAIVTALCFLRPAIGALLGEIRPMPFRSARAACALPANGPRADFMRATLSHGPDGVADVAPLAKQDSSMLSFLAKADALLFRPPGAAETPAGTAVPVLPLSEVLTR